MEKVDVIYKQDALEALRTCYDTERIDYTNGNEYINYEQAVHEVEQLSSAQPEQTDCVYCHEDFDGYVRPIEKNSHAWLIRRGRTMKLHVCFKGGYRECDILFCPMCGRRLADG